MRPGAGDAPARLIRIDHDPVPADAPAPVTRHAVRAVIRRGDLVLMVHSGVAGDYKFPGGGREPGETAHEAVIREVAEECGRTVIHVGPAILRTIEHRRAREPGQVVRMESTYHPCAVDDAVHEQRLDDYESALAFAPAWVALDEAIAVNQRILATGGAQTWVTRETRVLAALRDDS